MTVSAELRRLNNLAYVQENLFEPPPYVGSDGALHAEICCITTCPHTSQHHKTGCCIPEHWRAEPQLTGLVCPNGKDDPYQTCPACCRDERDVQRFENDHDEGRA